MKTYKLFLIYPGMNSRKFEVQADYFAVENGAYMFYVRNGGSDPVFVASYPTGLTIIESVTK